MVIDLHLPQYWVRLPADQRVFVRLTQICHEDVCISTSRDNLAKCLIGLQRPDSFLVTGVGGDTSLLSQRPEFDGSIAGSRQTLGTVSVQHQSLHIVRMSLQFHQFTTRSWIPDSQDLLCTSRHDNCA